MLRCATNTQWRAFCATTAAANDKLASIGRRRLLAPVIGTLRAFDAYCTAKGLSFDNDVAMLFAAQGDLDTPLLRTLVDTQYVRVACTANDEENDAAQRVLKAILRCSENAAMAAEVPEDLLCAICYTAPITMRFVPCGHASCSLCIGRHMVNSKLCFFCKAEIELVDEIADEADGVAKTRQGNEFNDAIDQMDQMD